mgnify:CR=1 FL=1
MKSCMWESSISMKKRAERDRSGEAGFRDVVEQDGRVEFIETVTSLSTTEDARDKTVKLWRERPEINVIATFNEWTSLGVAGRCGSRHPGQDDRGGV